MSKNRIVPKNEVDLLFVTQIVITATTAYVSLVKLIIRCKSSKNLLLSYCYELLYYIRDVHSLKSADLFLIMGIPGRFNGQNRPLMTKKVVP